jgi:hypothetical protein
VKHSMNGAKSMLGKGIEPLRPLGSRDFKSSNTPIVAGNNSRTTGNFMHGYAQPCAPSVTKSVTTLKRVLFDVVESIEGRA